MTSTLQTNPAEVHMTVSISEVDWDCGIDDEMKQCPYLCALLNHMQSLKCSLRFAVHVVLCQHPVIISTVKITFNLIHLCVVGCSSFIEPHFAKITRHTQKNAGVTSM